MQDFPLSIAAILRHGERVYAESECVTWTECGRPAHDLRGGRRQRGTARQRARRPRRRARRSRRHVLLEQPGAPRGVPRGAVDGRGAAHAQHPVVPRAARLRDQSRRGQGRSSSTTRSSRCSPRSRPSCTTVERYVVIGDGDASALAVGVRPPRSCATTSCSRREPHRIRVARDRRTASGGDVLHVGHDRQSEGCRVLAPLGLPALARRDHARPRSTCPSASASSRSCRCSTPTRGASRTRRSCAARARHAGPLPAGRAAARAWSKEKRVTFSGAVPDDLGRHPALRRRARDRPVVAAHDHLRRLGGAAFADGALRGALRRAHRAGVGHDRDVAARRGRASAGVGRARFATKRWTGATAPGASCRGVELRIVDDMGNPLPWDDEAVGEIEVRGPWITGDYFGDPSPEKFDDGWLRTGDVGSRQPARLRADHRPRQGRDQVGRRVDQLGRAREPS